MRTSTLGKRGALAGVAVLLATCGAAAPALADHDGRRSRAGVEITRVERCEPDAGRLQVGKQVFLIGGDAPLANLADAFRIAGFRAWRDGRCVFVRIDCERPALAWSSGSYNAQFQYRADCLVITLRPAEPECAAENGGWDRARDQWWNRGRAERRDGWRPGIQSSWGVVDCVEASAAIGRPIIPIRVGVRRGRIGVSVAGR